MKVTFSFAGLIERLKAFKTVTLDLCGNSKKQAKQDHATTGATGTDTFVPAAEAGAASQPGINIQFNKPNPEASGGLPAPDKHHLVSEIVPVPASTATTASTTAPASPASPASPA